MSGNMELIKELICNQKVFCTSTVIRTKEDGLGLKIYTNACRGNCHSIDGVTLFSKVDSNKLQ